MGRRKRKQSPKNEEVPQHIYSDEEQSSGSEKEYPGYLGKPEAKEGTTKKCEQVSCSKLACFIVTIKAYGKGEKAEYLSEAYDEEDIYVCRKHAYTKTVNTRTITHWEKWNREEEDDEEEVTGSTT